MTVGEENAAAELGAASLKGQTDAGDSGTEGSGTEGENVICAVPTGVFFGSDTLMIMLIGIVLAAAGIFIHISRKQNRDN